MDGDDNQTTEDILDRLIEGTGGVGDETTLEQTRVPVKAGENAGSSGVIDKNGNDLNGDSGHCSLDDSSLKTSSPISDRKVPLTNGSNVDCEKSLLQDFNHDSVESQEPAELLQAADEDIVLPVMTPIEDCIGMRESRSRSGSFGSSMPGLFPMPEVLTNIPENDEKNQEESETKSVANESDDENLDDMGASFEEEEDESRLVIDEPNKSIDETEKTVNEDDEALSDDSLSITDFHMMGEEEEESDQDDLLDEEEEILDDEESELSEAEIMDRMLDTSEDEQSQSSTQQEVEASDDKQPEEQVSESKSVDTEKPSNKEASTAAANDSELLCHEEFKSPEKASAPLKDNDGLFDKPASKLVPSDPTTPPAKVPTPGRDGHKRSFVDSLLSKIRESSDSSESESPSKLQKLLSESEDDLLVEIETPVEFNAPKNPNLLPTPIVRNQRSACTAFVTNEEEYNQSVAKHKIVRKPSHYEERNQVGSKTEQPRMRAPEMLSNAQRPRTLAEKRLLINGNNLNVLMLEQESRIYRQFQRNERKEGINYQLLDSIMNDPVPIGSGAFKALTWLRTRGTNFNYNYVNVNGVTYKLNGSRGNHKVKYLPDLTTRPFPTRQTTFVRPNRCCAGGRISKRTFAAVIASKNVKKFVLEASSDVHMQLDTKLLDNQLTSIKPRPLSKKVEFINANRKEFQRDEDSAFLGDYSTYKMPKIVLEVKVQPKTSLDPCAKRYLKEFLPHRDMTENWCEFALAAMGTKSEEEEKSKEVFEFAVPYQGNKRSILVRDILKKKEDNEKLRIEPYTGDDQDEDDMEWTFCKDCDLTDEIESEVVDVIKDLTNSVFLNLNDDLFTQDDPHDRNISSTISPIKVQEAIDELSNMQKHNPIKKTLKELKRLNANVFKSDSVCIDDENDMRRHATAHLAKDEREMRTTVIVTESDTILLGNHQKESRRIKRAPKRFEDYTGQDSQDEPAAKKARKNDYSYSQKIQPGTLQSYEDNKAIKKEVRHMIHCRVDVHQLDCLQDLEPWCMIHKLYKCQCKGEVPEPVQPKPPVKLPSIIRPLEPLKPGQSRRIFPVLAPSKPVTQKTSTITRSSSQDSTKIDDGTASRTVPVNVSNANLLASAVISSKDGKPKLEIVNLPDLINGRKGPIYISIHDNPTMRLNHILRSVLDNKSAIVSFDDTAYFIDKKRVDVKKLDFTGIINDLENPIFIIQSKDNGAPAAAEKDDIIEFSKSSMSVIPITDKSALNDISEILESILRNVRRKIELKLGEDPPEHIRQQLVMITSRARTQSQSNQSPSSTHSSPLSFYGRKLTEAPAPGLNSPYMKQFNEIFSLRMRVLVQMVKTNTLGLCPSRERLNKVYIYQWGLLLKSFEEGLIQVWQVTLEGEQGGKYQLMVITDSMEVPDVENADKDNIVNIRNLKLTDKITELTRLIILRIENASMTNLTVLLYGCKGYYRVCGLLNSKEPYTNGFVGKPNRQTDPRVMEKVQKIYRIWYSMKRSRLGKLPGTRLHNNRLQSVHAVPKAVAVVRPSIDPLAGMAKKPHEPGQAEHKWFLFNITSDFSDIFVRNWNRYLSFSVIMQAIARAKERRRAIALVPHAEHGQNWPKIYALPSSPMAFKDQDSMTKDFLIFGPYLRNSNSNLMLMQNVDGMMMSRESYEKKNNIHRKVRTRCLWIYANTMKFQNEIDKKPIIIQWANSEQKSNSFAEAIDDSSSSGERLSFDNNLV